MEGEVLAQCGLFASVSASDDDRRASVETLSSLLASGRVALDAVVDALSGPLCDPSAVVRCRGVALLSLLLQNLPVSRLDASAAQLLLTFFRDRSRDGPCVSEVLSGLSALISRWSLPPSQIELLLVTLFAEVFVSGLDQAGRRAAYGLIQLVLDRVPEAAVAMKHDFVYGYIQMIDGERDPRNLLFVFALTCRILRSVPGWERLSEELFDVTSCYFPINYTPRNAEDPITSAILTDALDAAIMCTPRFAEFYYPFMLEKLQGSGNRRVLWESVARSIEAFGGAQFGAHAPMFWSALQEDAFSGKDVETVETAAMGVTRIVAALSRDLVTDSAQHDSLDGLAEPLLKICLSRVSAVDSKEAHVAAVLLARAAAGSLPMARRVCNAAVPALSALVASPGVAEQLCALVAAAVAVAPSDLPNKSHPLFATAEVCQAAAVDLCGSARPELRVLGSKLLGMLCFRSSLASPEAQVRALLLALEQGPETARASVASMSAAVQAALFPQLFASLPSEAAVAGICALRPGLTLPGGGRPLWEALRRDVKSAPAVANLANKGLVARELVEQAVSSSSSLHPSELAWLARGLALSGDALAPVALSAVVARCSDAAAAESNLLSIVFDGQVAELSAASTHAVERPFSRQKALCLVFPLLADAGNLKALGQLALSVAPVALLGMVLPLLPKLLITVKAGRDDRGELEGALLLLGPVASEAVDQISVHTDTLLKQIADCCSHSGAEVRKAALGLLLTLAEKLPYPRIFAWQETILAGVAKALDDPRRDVRRLSRLVGSRFHALQTQ